MDPTMGLQMEFWDGLPKNGSPNNSGLGLIWMFPKIVGFPPPIIHFYRVFHYKPYILGYPYCWKHPYLGGGNSNMFYFHPQKKGEDEPNLTEIFFRWVGKSHQPDMNYHYFAQIIPGKLPFFSETSPRIENCRSRKTRMPSAACGAPNGTGLWGSWEHISPWWWRIKRIQRAMGQMYLIH